MTAYVISEVRVRDAALVQRYRAVASASIARYGGRYLVRGARPVAAEGRWEGEDRAVILEFPTMRDLRAWYRSPEYAEALALRPDALERRLLFVEGIDEDEPGDTGEDDGDGARRTPTPATRESHQD